LFPWLCHENAGSRTRTGTLIAEKRILSPLRLPSSAIPACVLRAQELENRAQGTVEII
jgi:hypothetical protein